MAIKVAKVCSLSTIEAELIATTKVCKEMFWLKRLLDEIGFKQYQYLVHCDSENVIHLNKNSSFHSRRKYINVRYQWVRDALDEKSLELTKIDIDKNISDMLTKVVTKEKHVFYQDGVGMEALSYVG